MAALLIVLAVLQYHWNAAFTAATQAQMGARLELLSIRWQVDFYNDISAICVASQVGPDSGARDSWKDYLQRYVEWAHAKTKQDSAESIYTQRDLVKGIYIWKTSQSTKPRLLRLDAENETIENSDVPEDLRTLLPRLQSRSSSLPVALCAWEFTDLPADERFPGRARASSLDLLHDNPASGWQFDKNIPAIVHPIIHHDHYLQRSDTHSPASQSPIDWIVVVLNTNVIQKRILPKLAERHFGGQDGLGYKLAVVDFDQTPSLIYSSDPEFGNSELGDYDATVNIFGVPVDPENEHSEKSVKNRNGSTGKECNSLRRTGWFPVIQYTSHDEPWVLRLQHRQGTLRAVAAKMWQTNLITGGMLLALLAASMTLLVIAGQREHELVKVQMDFVASVSHQLRTPLAAILSAGQNIADGFVDNKPTLMRHGSIITGQARQLIDLVDRVLLFAYTENSRGRYIVRPLRVSEIFECVRKNTTGMLVADGFTVEEHLPTELPRVVGDLSALCQCLQNLVANAIKYSGKNRWIGLSAKVEEGERRSKEVQISVQDRGIGISRSELPRIFEPFYRSPRAMSAQVHGTGLGLAIANRLAKAMGGRLSVVSDVNVGSIFTLHLPALKEDNFDRAIVASKSNQEPLA